MDRMKLILKSMLKKKIVVILMIFQLTVSLLLLFNLIISLNSVSYLENKIKNKIDTERSYHLIVNVKLDSGEQCKRINEFEKEVSNLKGVDGIGSYDYTNVAYEELINDDDYLKIRDEITLGTYSQNALEASDIINLDWYMFKLMNIEVSEGKNLIENDFESVNEITPILIGNKFSNVINVGTILTDEITKKKYIVKGIMKKGTEWFNEGTYTQSEFVNLDNEFLVPYTGTDKDNLDVSGGRLQSIFYKLDSNINSSSTNKQIEDLYKKIVGEKTITKSIQQEVDYFNKNGKSVREFLMFIIGFLFISSIIGMSSVMISSIKSRVREIGIQVMAGASKKYINSLIIGEILLINLISLVIVLAISIFIFDNIKSMITVFIISTNIIIVITLLTSILPLIFLKRLTPKELIGGIE